MALQLLTGYESELLLGLFLAIVAGFFIGLERESRGKDAGISTHTLVIVGAVLFSFLSNVVDPFSKSRIAAQIVVGIGFLGAGMILVNQGNHVKNLTTAASIWVAAGIGMCIGYHFYLIAMIATVACILVPRMPHLKKSDQET
jgi:putative Mg2+ transporter-C (MgtC) family protein